MERIALEVLETLNEEEAQRYCKALNEELEVNDLHARYIQKETPVYTIVVEDTTKYQDADDLRCLALANLTMAVLSLKGVL